MKSFAHEISGLPVQASDGEIGTVKDFVVDPDGWRVRYLEVSTGWLFGRDVLIPIDKVAGADVPEGSVRLDLTKEQIEKSPPAETARPIERAYENRLVGYYGLSPYWAAPPEVGVPPQAVPVDTRTPEEAGRPELVFAGDLDGYDLDAQGENAGTVRDLLVDLDTWKVTGITADLGGLFAPDTATIAIGPVTGIDTANQVVHVSISKQKVDRSHRLGLEDLPYVFPYVPPIA